MEKSFGKPCIFFLYKIHFVCNGFVLLLSRDSCVIVAFFVRKNAWVSIFSPSTCVLEIKASLFVSSFACSAVQPIVIIYYTTLSFFVLCLKGRFCVLRRVVVTIERILVGFSLVLARTTLAHAFGFIDKVRRKQYLWVKSEQSANMCQEPNFFQGANGGNNCWEMHFRFVNEKKTLSFF